MVVNGVRGQGALNLGLDFTGGTSLTIPFNEYEDTRGEAGNELRQLISDNGNVTNIQLQNVQDSNNVIVKTPVMDSETRDQVKMPLPKHTILM